MYPSSTKNEMIVTSGTDSMKAEMHMGESTEKTVSSTASSWRNANGNSTCEICAQGTA